MCISHAVVGFLYRLVMSFTSSLMLLIDLCTSNRPIGRIFCVTVQAKMLLWLEGCMLTCMSVTECLCTE